MNYNIVCPVCQNNNYDDLIKLEKYPVSNVGLAVSKEEALQADVFDMNICICRDCSHIYNRTPVKINYKQHNTTFFTNDIQKKYIQKSAKNLVEKYNLKNKNILEIGSGDGYLLKCLVKNNNSCIGYEPSLQDIIREGGVVFINDYFNPSIHLNKKFDFIILRHILEHFDNPYKFLREIIYKLVYLDYNVKFFIEVPNIEPTLKNLRINDFIHEHISHFSKYSLKYLLQRLNLDILEIYTTQNNENIVTISQINKDFITKMNNIVIIKNEFNIIIDKLRNDFKLIREKNLTIAIWGAEGRGASFIKNIKDLLRGDEFIIDSDEKKFGKYIPSIGLKISSYEELIDRKIDAIIITTAVGKDNILQEIKENNIDVKNIYCFSQFGLNLIYRNSI